MAFSEITDDIEKVDAARGAHLALTAGASITAGQLVKLTGDNTVEPSDSDGEEIIGVATQSVASGDTLTVNSVGILSLVRAATSVDAQDPVASHGGTGESGEVATADGTGDFIAGIALESISGGDTGVALLTLAGEVN